MDAWLIVLICVLSAVLLCFVLFLVLIAPGKAKSIGEYKNVKFAHRGLHDESKAENSMSAFRAAVLAGFGIELDIRLSSDGQLVVFHDDTLDRVVGTEGRVDAFSSEQLAAMSLSGTEDGVPLFSDVLSLVDGKVPLLVEIKEDAGNYAVSDAAAKMLAEYKGDYIVESFNPLSLANIKKKLPGATRGVLSHKYYDYERYRRPLYFLLQNLCLNRVCSPSFIAYDHRHAKNPALRIARRLFGAATFAWTVRSPQEEAEAYKNGFDSIIFENYIPEK